MAKLCLIALCLVVCVYGGTFKPTKQFWSAKLNYTVAFEAYAGYEQIDKYKKAGTSGMFYQLFSTFGRSVNTSNSEIPLIIWLQGGPGSSSQFGAFTEIGPIKISNGAVSERDYSWNMFGHTLFIDSPLNVGFSYSGDNRTGDAQVSSTDEATNHLINFLNNFYVTWPALKASPIYITGESYAGKYIPVLAHKLIYDTPIPNITLAGIAIGNGWTDPINQVNFYDSFLWSVGVIDKGFRGVCNWYQVNSVINMDHNDWKKATEYFDFLTNNDTTPEYYMGNISMFNFRRYNEGPDRSYAQFMEKNKAEFGVADNITFIKGNPKIYTAFGADISQSVARQVSRVLQKIRVLIYNGQDDVVVNNAGVQLYLNSLTWSGIKEWRKTPKMMWTTFNEIKGWVKYSGNLWFVQVNGAGHMVPTDQPRAAWNMLGHFISKDTDWRG